MKKPGRTETPRMSVEMDFIMNFTPFSVSEWREVDDGEPCTVLNMF